MGGRAGAGRGGRRWAGAWGAVGGGSRAKPSPDFHPAAAQAGGCLEHPGLPGLCRPHGHHQLPPRRGPSTQVQPIPIPSTQSPPAPAHPSPGCFLGAHSPPPAVPRTAPHDDCTHDAYQHDSTAHTTTPRSRTTKTASQWDLPRGCTPGATAPRGRGRRAGPGLGALLFLLVWRGGPWARAPPPANARVPGAGELLGVPIMQTPPLFLPCSGGTRGRTPTLSHGSPSAFPASPCQLLHTPMQSWGAGY